MVPSQSAAHRVTSNGSQTSSVDSRFDLPDPQGSFPVCNQHGHDPEGQLRHPPGVGIRRDYARGSGGAAPTSGDAFVTKNYADTNYGGAAAASKTYVLTGTTSTVTGSDLIPANSIVTGVEFILGTALDGTTPAISIGTTATAALFVASADVNVAAANTTSYNGLPISVGGSNVAPRVTVTGTGITTGAWEVVISYTVTPSV